MAVTWGGFDMVKALLWPRVPQTCCPQSCSGAVPWVTRVLGATMAGLSAALHLTLRLRHAVKNAFLQGARVEILQGFAPHVSLSPHFRNPEGILLVT